VSRSVRATGKNRYEVAGDLTMHGVTKRVVLNVTYSGAMKDQRGAQRVGFSANTRLNRKDFGITWNRVLDAGNTILGDEVDVTLEVSAVEKK
ncbi:MAG: YceI family protein, partial [Armatimonadota bacterium]|nr:YceI family protein [Armatimonadota bacterium]